MELIWLLVGLLAGAVLMALAYEQHARIDNGPGPEEERPLLAPELFDQEAP